jgi:hypothetical protein
MLILQRIAPILRRHPDLRGASLWSLALILPICLALFVWRTQPDGRLHVVFVSGEDGEAALILAPNGRTAWIWDGRGDGKALVEATRRDGWVRSTPDLVLAACDSNPWQGAACVDPGKLAAATSVALTGDVRLVRLATSGPPALLLTYGRFRTLLPATLHAEAQATLDPAPALSVLKTAAPGAGAWPTVEFLSSVRPQLVLLPLETTYPPDVTRYLANKVKVALVEAEGATEVVSDGKQFWVLRHAAAGPQ